MNAMDQHFALLDTLRSEKDTQRQKTICISDIALVDQFNREYIREYGKPLPKSYPSFKKLAVIYEKEGNYTEAIEVCRKAIAAGYKQDGTQGGMSARMNKLKEKQKLCRA